MPNIIFLFVLYKFKKFFNFYKSQNLELIFLNFCILIKRNRIIKYANIKKKYMVYLFNLITYL